MNQVRATANVRWPCTEAVTRPSYHKKTLKEKTSGLFANESVSVVIRRVWNVQESAFWHEVLVRDHVVLQAGCGCNTKAKAHAQHFGPEKAKKKKKRKNRSVEPDKILCLAVSISRKCQRFPGQESLISRVMNRTEADWQMLENWIA